MYHTLKTSYTSSVDIIQSKTKSQIPTRSHQHHEQRDAIKIITDFLYAIIRKFSGGN